MTKKNTLRKKPKQLDLLPKPKREHGGSLAVKKRRSFRPMNSKLSLHITLKSQHAVGGRCLFRHKKRILFVMRKASKLFHVKVYNYAIAGNHLHLLIKGPDRESLQNFFRVFAGHTAQGILRDCPLTLAKPKPGAPEPGGAPANSAKTREPCKKNQRKFWSYLLYTRIVTWGREFKRVHIYIEKNVLETLHVIAYEPRKLKKLIKGGAPKYVTSKVTEKNLRSG